MKKFFFFLALFCSISFSSLVWQTGTGGAVSTKPVVFSNGIVIASNDGSVVMLNPTTGGKTWKTTLHGTPVQPVLLQSWVVVGTTKGNIAFIKPDGTVERELNFSANNVTYLFGIDSSSTKIFATTDKGLFAIGTGGTNVTSIYNSTNLKTAPTVSGTSVFFGEGEDLVKISEKGTVEWRQNVGGVWLSRPAVDGQSVYVGGLDNKLHALTLSGGAERWTFATGNWVLSSPYVKNGIVYFGSNDGNVYAVQNDGRMLWSAKTPLAIETKPEPGMLGGKQVIFIGSTSNAVYAIEIENGGIVWKGSSGGWAADPLYFNKRVIFGSQDKNANSYSTERACSIVNPRDGEVVGLKEIKVMGNAVSESGSPTVYVSVNDQDMQQANISNESWVYYLDPSIMNSGLNSISCKVSDSGGEESGSLTKVEIIRDPSANLSKLVVATSGSLLDGEPFSIHVNDGDDGSPVERFNVTLDGNSFEGSGSINVTMSSGAYTMVVKKTGFSDSSQTVTVASTGLSPLYIGLAVVAILVAAWFIYKKVLKR